MLQNACLLAKIGADTAENERNFAYKVAKNLQLPYPTIHTLPCNRKDVDARSLRSHEEPEEPLRERRVDRGDVAERGGAAAGELPHPRGLGHADADLGWK